MNIIDGYCNGFKVKYVYMDKLFGDRLDATSKGKKIVQTVNIFINFESLYNVIRRKNLESAIENASKKEIKHLYRNAISDFINVAAHYRAYFTRHKIQTNIIYYYNEIVDDYIDYNNTALIPTYRNHFVESLTALDRFTINALIHDSIPFMNIISEYIDGMYMVGTKRVEASLIPFVIMMENTFPANMNIIITKDQYDYQYCAQNCLIVSKYAKDPIFLTKKNIMKFMRHKYRIKETKETREINAALLTFILTFMGDRKRSIPGIEGLAFGRIYRALESLYDVGYIFDEEPETMSIEHLCDVLKTYGATVFKDNENLKEDIMYNYRAFDFEYQYKVMSKSQKDGILDQLKNKCDPQALMDLNEKYFEFYPLMLLELNQYKSKNDLMEFLD